MAFSFASSLDDTLDEVWARLSRGVADRRAPARQPVLSTVDPSGRPQSRIVVLRAQQRATGVLDIHTDLHSAKIADLASCPHAQLLIWEPSVRLQIRLAADVDIVTGEAVRPVWDKVPDGARQAYGGAPKPGQEISSADVYQPGSDFSRFAVLRCHLTQIETLCLAPDRHYRALFSRSRGFAGQWLAP